MQTITLQRNNHRFSTPIIYGLMIILGILSGTSDIAFLKTLGLLIAEVFIKLFKCISLPIICLSIIVTLSNYRAQGIMRKVWRYTLYYTLTTTLVAAAVSCILYLLIKPVMAENIVLIPGLQPTQPSYLQHLTNLIPASIFTPFLEQQVLSVLLLGIVIGIAIRFIPDQDARQTITHFFHGAHGLFMVITRWIIAIIPIGLYGFITTTVVQLHNSNTAIKSIGQYLSVIVLANLVQGLIILPLWLWYKGLSPFGAMKKMSPALSLAFFSKSSVGALPVTMNTIEKNLHIKPEISRFVLPLCTSINMNGCAAFIFTTVIYLMQNQGIPITLGTMAIWIVVATIAAIGNAGVPMGCFFLSASLLASMNVPITLLGVILPFYSLLDMLETALNVWSDICVTKVVNQSLHHNSA